MHLTSFQKEIVHGIENERIQNFRSFNAVFDKWIFTDNPNCKDVIKELGVDSTQVYIPSSNEVAILKQPDLNIGVYELRQFYSVITELRNKQLIELLSYSESEKLELKYIQSGKLILAKPAQFYLRLLDNIIIVPLPALHAFIKRNYLTTEEENQIRQESDRSRALNFSEKSLTFTKRSLIATFCALVLSILFNILTFLKEEIKPVFFSCFSDFWN